MSNIISISGTKILQGNTINYFSDVFVSLLLIFGFFVFYRMYTTRIKLESTLRREEKNARDTLPTQSAAVEQSPSVVIITDLNGNIEYVNPKFTKITGYSKEEVLGKNPRFLKSGYFQENMYKEMWETISADNAWRGEFHNKKKNGDLYWEMASI